MEHETRSRMHGAFTGYHGGAVFRLANGQVWQQRRYRYEYRYAYRPEVRIYRQDGRHMMEVPIMSSPIEVVRAKLVVEGAITSDFKGFNDQMKFEIDNAQVWVQAEYKYSHHYAYRPHALIISGINGTELQVDGMNETVQVRRIR